MRQFIIFTILVSLFTFRAAAVYAKPLYVDGANPGCSDSTTYADNDESNPWCTLGRAAWGSSDRGSSNSSEAATAGDIVYVAPGIYSAPAYSSDAKFMSAFLPVNEGTVETPLVFQAVGVVELRLSSGAGSVIGSYQKDYVAWRGFSIDEAYAPSVADTGAVVIWDATGVEISGCTIDGNGTAGDRMDNHTGIRLEYAVDPVIRNNTIHSVTTGLGLEHHNGAGIMAYFSSGALIENNYLYGSGAGVFVKGGDNADFIVRYNLISANGSAVDLQYTAPLATHLVYQNVIYNSAAGIKIALNSHGISSYNNTIYNCANGVHLGVSTETSTNIQFTDNIIHATSEWFSGGEASSGSFLSLDYNLYYGTSNGWSLNGSLYTTLSTWRSALGGSENGDEYHSVSGADPLLADPSGGDFTLSAGSPAAAMSSSSGPVGAYITGLECIGLEHLCSSSLATPSAVGASGNFSIQ